MVTHASLHKAYKSPFALGRQILEQLIFILALWSIKACIAYAISMNGTFSPPIVIALGFHQNVIFRMRLCSSTLHQLVTISVNKNISRIYNPSIRSLLVTPNPATTAVHRDFQLRTLKYSWEECCRIQNFTFFLL
ncbi:hypothetical protein BT93_E2641 [Corymbia citriodora subsp. variegata]|nr:hypothetical protein BT93_E2641 [Corymbia citriodora subsp. variegata]